MVVGVEDNNLLLYRLARNIEMLRLALSTRVQHQLSDRLTHWRYKCLLVSDLRVMLRTLQNSVYLDDGGLFCRLCFLLLSADATNTEHMCTHTHTHTHTHTPLSLCHTHAQATQ